MNIDISKDEQKFMGDILTKELEDVRVEFRRTKNHDYKLILKREEDMLRDLLDRFTPAGAEN
ncbi:hypothetical protein PITCH_A1010003 [uncultured Desulfobacterium sp.]|uniref:Uncharacterized protein n=1 Tax=uncultured Desulfobacterium sp. TaxID=201089 RepID=A0A445MQJ8_9BACT|nr:hypothetical protein PITCH_A1010003 [uncultured Desulfobacterium sp.]